MKTPSLRLSCLPVSYFPDLISGKMSLSDWIEEGAGFGLTAVDVSRHFFQGPKRVERIKETKTALEKTGVELALFNTYPRLVQTSRESRSLELEQLLADIAIAGEAGAAFVRLVAGEADPDIPKPQGVAWVVEGFERAAEAAKKHGVGLVFENHSKPGSWEHPDFAFDPEVYFSIVDAIKHLPISLLFDTANAAAAGWDPLDFLKRIYRKTSCIHAADTTTFGTFAPCPIGAGAVQFTPLFCYLKEKGFPGYVSIEEASFKGHEGLREAIDYIKEVWKDDSHCG